MIVETFGVGRLGCNCSIVADETTRRALVIDPGGDLEVITARLAKLGLTVEGILHTHTHIDHVGATGDLQRATGAAARIHEADRFMLELLPLQARFVGVATPAPAEIEGDLTDGAVVRVGGLELSVMHTPGHSPGSVCFFVRGPEGPVLFAGDTLFRLGIGRTDLWGGDGGAILRSIRQRLYVLDESTRVIPGHGEETTIGDERAENPFVRAR